MHGCAHLCNDPSEGSPTDTLLRLVLPLALPIRTTFRQAICPCGQAPIRRAHRQSRIGSSDGRCVQRTGTESWRAPLTRHYGTFLVRGECSRLLSQVRVSAFKIDPPCRVRAVRLLSAPTSVARVRPRTSKGITDLLLLLFAWLLSATCPSKKFISDDEGVTPAAVHYRSLALRGRDEPRARRRRPN